MKKHPEEEKQGEQPIKKNQGPNRTSHLLGPGLLVRRALAHDGRLEASSKIVGQLVEFLVAVDLNGLFRRIADHIAVVAPSKMILELGFRLRIDHTIKVVG
jgi:hypothetical protein